MDVTLRPASSQWAVEQDLVLAQSPMEVQGAMRPVWVLQESASFTWGCWEPPARGKEQLLLWDLKLPKLA